MSVAVVDAFKKIRLLPDGTELIADRTSDTLTLKAGTGVNFLVSADGTSGVSPGQGPVVEIYNTGQGLATIDEVLKLGNQSNQSITVGSATIDSLQIEDNEIRQTVNNANVVLRTAPSLYTLAPFGTTPPTPVLVSGSIYTVTFPLDLTSPAPATGVWYLVTNHANSNYNGVYFATASTTTSLTLRYESGNPGTYGLSISSLSANGAVVRLTFTTPQLAAPFVPYVDGAGDYVMVSGFNPSSYNGFYPVSACTTTYVEFTSGVTAAVISNGVVTKPTSAATASGTGNVVAVTNNLIIASTQGLKVPIGTTAQRPTGPTPLNGFIRYNTDLSSFEGYVGTAGWASLGGVKSVDGYTYISAENNPGVSDDTLRFYTSTNAPGSFLSLTIDKDNTTILTKGLVIPKGNNTTDRPASPVSGMIRYNTTDNVFEGYTTAWSSLGGVRSVDGQTLIRAETSASASNDRLDFITSLNTSVTSTTDIGDIITVNSTANLYIGQPIEFVGTIVGGVTAGVEYYVKTINGLNITISTDPALSTTQAISPDTSGNPMYIVTKAFTADKDNVKFSSKGLVIPTGNSASRPGTPLTGQVRFNTETGQFEGYIGTAWSSLGGVRSVDGLTYITAENTPGASDDTLHFFTATSGSTTAETAQINSSGVTILDNKYLSIRESTINGTREVRLKAPAQLDTTGGTYTLTMPTKLGVAGNLLALNNTTGTLEFVTSDQFGGQQIKVSAANGNDANDGINLPVKTIKRGLQLASALVYTASNSFNTDICYRDSGLILEAIGWDLAYGGNWQTVKSGLTYSLNAASLVLSSQKTITVNALKYLQTKAVTTQTGNPATIVNNKAQVVVDIVNGSTAGVIPTIGSGSVPAVSMPTPTGAVANAGNTKDRMLANVAFLKAEVSAWIDAQIAGNIAPFVGFTYTGTSRTRCERDVEYIIYSTVYDYIYGGNSQSVDAGLKYWDGLGTAAILQETDQAQTAAAINRIKACIQTIASGGTVTKTPANAQTQVTSPAGVDAAASGTIASLFDVVTNILNNGVGVAPTITYPTATFTDAVYSSSSATLTTAKTNLIAKKADIQTAVVSSAANYVPNGKKIVVSVANGDYYEDNPIIVADNISVLGAGLRSAIVRPLNANKDLLRVRNGVYFGEFTFRDHLTGGGITGVPDFTWDYAVAFDNINDNATSRVGYTLPITKPTITTSPYIQAVSLISFLGGNGAYVDGSLVNTPNIPGNQIEAENPVSGPAPEQGKSMVANAFTMLSFGGTGWRLTNDAYAQIVSCFQIFMLHGSYCLSGGYLSITNSATNFGLYALRSTGYSPNAFQFDKGIVVGSGLITGGIQTLTAIGFGRAPTVHYITRFRTPDYKISYDLLRANKSTTQDAVITAAGTAGYTFTYFTTSVTNFATATSVFTATSTANFTVGEKVEFTGTTFAGISVGSTYYIKTIPSNTTFTLSTSSTLDTTYTFGSNASGTMTMKFKHDTVKSNRDLGLIIEAVAYDVYTGGNQQSVLAGQSYYTAGTLVSGLTGQSTQCQVMINVAKGLSRTYVSTSLSTPAVLGGYGLVVNWTGGTAGTLSGATVTPLSATFTTASVSGNVLTVTTLASGTIAVGMAIVGVTAGTYIVGTNGVSTGNGSTWILNQAATGTPTAARSTGYTTGDVVTIWSGNSNATATVTASSGVVTALVINNAGTGYTATGTKVTASVASSIVGKFDLISAIINDVSIAPTAIAYGNFNDISSNYIPGSQTFSFNAATGVNATTNTITIPYTGQSLYFANGKKINYSPNSNAEIPGLDQGQPYYLGGVTDNGSTTTFNLYFDQDLKNLVDIISVGSGTHQFIADQKDFFINSIIESHRGYQSIVIGSATQINSFAPGQLISGSTSGASGYVYSWNNVTKTLIVSLNLVLVGGSTIRQQFQASENIGTFTISSVQAISNYYTAQFTVIYSDSTIATLVNTGNGGYPGGMYNTSPALSGGAGAVSAEIWLHRPSIVNSSGHTWEYAGSGTDYNALPQNGGQTDFSKEQWSDYPGRVYSSGTNELGDFKVGNFIVAENRTGNVSFTNTVTVNALNVLKLALGSITISEISNDIGLGDNEQGGAKDSRLSTQLAIKTYIANGLGPFLNKPVSTNAVPNAIPQLNSSGQLDPSQIPAIRTFSTFRSQGYNSRTALVEEIPANDVLNGDIGTEVYSTVQLTLSAPVTALRGDLVTQANTTAEGYLTADVTNSSVITVGSLNTNFFRYVNGVATNYLFNNTAANTLTIAGDSTPSTSNGTVYPSSVGTIATGIENNYVLSNAMASQYLILDPAGTYTFINITVGTGATLINGTQYIITNAGSGVNWTSIGASAGTVGTIFTYNGTTPTHTTTAGTADIYNVYSANENYESVLAGVLGGAKYRAGVLTNGAITQGSGYTNGVYYNVSLTNVSSSGSGATADITVVGGKVTNLDLRRGGTGYAVNDTLSAASAAIGAGAGFVYTISSIEKRLYVNIVNGVKSVANTVSPNFIQDNSATVKSIASLTTNTSLNFNNANTSTGGNVNVTNNSFDITSHGFSNGDPIRLNTIAFGGLTFDTVVYYVSVINANSFRLFLNYNLSTVFTITGSGAGGANSGQFVRYTVDTVNDSILLAAHGYSTGDAVKIVGASLPTYLAPGGATIALTTNTFYFVGSITTNSFTLHATRQNALDSVNGLTLNAVALNGSGSGSMSFIKQNVRFNAVVNTSSVSTTAWSSLTTNNVDASNIISGTISPTRLGSGTANSDTFLRGDNSWQYAVQGIKETQTPLTLTGSSYTSTKSATFTAQIRGVRYLNDSPTPNKTGAGPYLVTYTFASTIAPTVPLNYIVQGANTAGYNGTYASTASSATSITLSYSSDPGTWTGGTTYIYNENGNILWVSAVASGTITLGMTLSGSGISTTPKILSNISGNGSSGASAWTIDANLARIENPTTGSISENIFYNVVSLDIDKVDGNQTLSAAVTNYTPHGVASFNTTQFYVGQPSSGDIGQVRVRDNVIDAARLAGQLPAYYTNSANHTIQPTQTGGTGFDSYAVGDILYAVATSGAGSLAKLNIGTANQILTSSGSSPQWSSNLSVPGDVTIAGNLTVNGITTTVNSSTITVDDKNIELGSVSSKPGLQATLSTGTAVITLTVGDTTGLIPGMLLTKTGGGGAFGVITVTGNITAGSAIITNISSTTNIAPGAPVTLLSGAGTVTLPADTKVLSVNSSTQITLDKNLTGTGTATGATVTIASVTIASVNSLTQITASVNHGTAGSITFDVSGTSDITANGGGITLKGTTDKTFQWSNLTGAWTSSEDLNLASGKVYEINGTAVLSASQVLGKTIGGTSAGDIVSIDSAQTLTNKILRDSSTTIQDEANTLKQFQVQAATVGGSGATFTVNTNGSGQVSSITLATAGTGYQVNDIITIEGPGSPSAKVSLTVNTVGSGGTIATFTPTVALPTGTGYTASQTAAVVSTAIGSAVATRIYSVPPATTTLVGTDSVQTLTNKTFTAPSLSSVTTFSLRDTAAAFDLTLQSTSNTVLTANRTLTLDVNDNARTIDIAGNLTLANNFTTSGNFALTLTQTATTNVTLPTTGTLATLAGAESLTNKTLAVGTTTFKDTSANIPARFALSTGTGLVVGGLTVTNGVVQATPTPTTVNAGYGYVVNDRVKLNGGNNDAVYLVTSVNTSGGVTGLSFVTGGTGYTPLSGNTPGQQFNTTASTVDGETALRTYTFPSSDGTDTVVTEWAVQTLRNKTIDSPTIGTQMVVPVVYGSTLSSGTLTLRSTTNATKPTGGVKIDENIASTSTSTGSLVVTGGTGISLDLWVGGSAYVANSVRSNLITTNTTADLVLNTNNGTNSGNITIRHGVGGNINITPDGAGIVTIGNTSSSGVVTTGSNTANLVLSTNNGTTSGTITITAGVNGNISITPNGSGTVSVPTINKVTITAPATGSTLTIADGKTLTANNTLTFTGTDGSSAAFGTGGTVAYQGGNLSQFAATTSAQLAGVISDETGSGALVFGTSPSFTTDIRTPKVTTSGATNLILDTNAGTNSGTITINQGTNGNIAITPNGTGVVNIGNTASSGVLTTGSASANLVLSTNNGTNSGTITIAAGANQNITITPNGTGVTDLGDVSKVKITGGSNTNLLGTNGSGVLSWVSANFMVYPSAGIANSTGSAWGTSYSVSGTGSVVALTTNPVFVTNITTPVVTGSSAANGTLTLRSTSDATKGAVLVDENTASTSANTGALRVTGGVGVTGNMYVGNGSRVGWTNASNTSAVYQVYNAATNSLDTIFG